MSASAQPLPPECDSVVLTADDLERRVSELGADIAARYAGEDLRLITVLRGGVFFLADLCRTIDAPLRTDFLAVAPYAPGVPGVRVTKDLDDDVGGARIVLVEDIVDTGLTLNYVRKFLLARSPASVEVCALLDKPARRIADVPLEWTGFTLSDRFLVGYGLDLFGRYRNLPFVATVRDEVVFG